MNFFPEPDPVVWGLGFMGLAGGCVLVALGPRILLIDLIG